MSDDNEIPAAYADLAASDIADPKRAGRNLDLIRRRLGDGPFSLILPDLLHSLARTADPDMALNNLERFLGELDPPSRFVEGVRLHRGVLHQLLVLFGASRFLSSYCAATAGESLGLLCRPEYLARPAGKDRLGARLAASLDGAEGEEELFRVLRRFRKRELVRIALRDLLGKADLTETVEELSHLAEVCIQTACERADAALRSRYGRPLSAAEEGTSVPAGFAVIGMGKLGGRELNFSSDVDLMYVYSADGETGGTGGPEGSTATRISNHQYFVKLGEKVSAAIGRATADGFVFRVDLRLRPEGQRGPLAQSLGGYEIYYESWGQTWERSALIKARCVAGDEAVGREFIGRITPFVYRKYLDFGAIVEIREMKGRINREVDQKGKAHRDVKLGYGGIREIEFLVQALQLIYGGRDRGLRERGTLRALHTLAQRGLLSYQETDELSKAYTFLRTVEHRIQLLDDLQSQTLPAGGTELRALARRCGYLESGSETESLLREYAVHTGRVRRIYDELLSQQAPEEEEGVRPDYAVLLDPGTAEQDAAPLLERYGFRDASRAFRNFSLLREGQAFVHQTPRSRRVFEELFPLLFEEIVRSPDPDMALNHFESYLGSQGSWDAFQALVRQDVRSLKVLVSVFGNSEYFSRMLVRSPALIEDLMDASSEAGVGSRAFLEQGLAGSLAGAPSLPEKLDTLRRFKHREELRIGMADLRESIPLAAVCRGLSRLAEACLASALRIAAAETAKRYGGPADAGGLAVIGAGKLGGRELIYGSDLDILFAFDEAAAGADRPGITTFEYFSKIAERTLSFLSSMTREGAAYRVDTRLRPSGSKGPLVQSITAFRNYYASHAGTWERQAMVNARFVAGDPGVAAGLAEELRDLVFRRDDPAALAEDIRSMRQRMQEERGKEDGSQYNIKQGAGGLVDIEFLVQYLQLLHGSAKRRLRVPGTLNGLRALRLTGVLSPGDHLVLTGSYLFLRKLEGRLRIVSNLSTSFLPKDPDKLRPLARRMGCGDREGAEGEELLREFESTAKRVRELYKRIVAP